MSIAERSGEVSYVARLSGGPTPAPTGEVSALEVLRPLIARWRLILAIALVITIVAAAASLVIPHQYTATTSFVSERPRGVLPAALSGLAGQIGIPAVGEDSWSPQFYVALARSQAVLERILLSEFASTPTGDSARLLDLLDLPSNLDEDEALFAGLEKLGEDLRVTFDPPSNVIRLSVDAPEPRLAADVANRFVAYLGDFNTETRQSRVRRRREFVQGQAEEAESALRMAEEELRLFYDTNRNWAENSLLDFEEGRLSRQVDLRQELYLTLRRELANASIEEVNDTPVITVIDEATPPIFRSWPRRKLIVAAAVLGGILVGMLVAYVIEYVRTAKSYDSSLSRG
jgi:uncharacterized protein involved in exopolysaccharide biosynthesis